MMSPWVKRALANNIGAKPRGDAGTKETRMTDPRVGSAESRHEALAWAAIDLTPESAFIDALDEGDEDIGGFADLLEWFDLGGES